MDAGPHGYWTSEVERTSEVFQVGPEIKEPAG